MLRVLGLLFILLVILGVSASAAGSYGYSNVEVRLVDVKSVTPELRLDFGTIAQATIKFFTGDLVGAGAAFVDNVQIVASARVENNSFVPLYIPTLKHIVTIEGQRLGTPIFTDGFPLLPGKEESIDVNITLKRGEVPKAVWNLITKGDELTLDLERSSSLRPNKVVYLWEVIARRPTSPHLCSNELPLT